MICLVEINSFFSHLVSTELLPVLLDAKVALYVDSNEFLMNRKSKLSYFVQG